MAFRPRSHRVAAALLGLIAPLAFAPPTSARTWHILNDGSGDASTVQAGIDSAAAGDTVLVGPGTYLENLSIVGKDLVLKSELGPEITILDGSSQQETVIYLSGQTRAMVVEGFTITGGAGHPRSGVADGGGIHLTDFASPTIRGNSIIQNGVDGVTFFGGGIGAWTSSASPLIENNLFQGNTALLGGAISIPSGETVIRGNTFRDNNCYADGGAIRAQVLSGLLTIQFNQFWENSAGDHGGGIYADGNPGARIHIEWNLFVLNRAEGFDTGDTGAGGAVRIRALSGSIQNNTMVGGVGLTESACGGGGLSLEATPVGLSISDNIIALNRSCGIACRYGNECTLGPNLFWMNTEGDIGFGSGTCPSEWTANQIFADPLFCGPEVGNYTVAVNSPALTGPVPMGVWTTPGCGPGVPVQTTTWGRLKSLYR